MDPIHGSEIEFFDTDEKPEVYRRRVVERVDQLSETLGSEEASILGGKPVAIPEIVEEMRGVLADADAEWADWGGFLSWRHKFEAATGCDCSRFYDDNQFEPLVVASILEDFLDREVNEDYESGKRYFFGRPVPSESAEA